MAATSCSALFSCSYCCNPASVHTLQEALCPLLAYVRDICKYTSTVDTQIVHIRWKNAKHCYRLRTQCYYGTNFGDAVDIICMPDVHNVVLHNNTQKTERCV